MRARGMLAGGGAKREGGREGGRARAGGRKRDTARERERARARASERARERASERARERERERERPTTSVVEARKLKPCLHLLPFVPVLLAEAQSAPAQLLGLLGLVAHLRRTPSTPKSTGTPEHRRAHAYPPQRRAARGGRGRDLGEERGALKEVCHGPQVHCVCQHRRRLPRRPAAVSDKRARRGHQMEQHVPLAAAARPRAAPLLHQAAEYERS